MKRENGFVLFPILIIAALVAGTLFMTAPNSVKSDVAKKIHLEK